MSRGPYRRGVIQRERIIAVAAEHFGRYGYSGATLRAIATQIGVSHTSLVQLFGTKERLLMAVLDAWDSDLTDELGSRSGVDFLVALGDLMARHRTRRGIVELFLRMSIEATDPGHPARDYILTRSTRVHRLIREQIELAASAGELRALDPAQADAATREIVAAMNGLELQWLLDDRVDLGVAFAGVLDRWLRGLA